MYTISLYSVVVYCILHLQRQLPEPEQNLPALCVQSAISQWQQTLTSQTLEFSLEMGTIISCVDCKGSFVKTEYQADEDITVEIYLKLV